ncbi:MAG: hypothetical protein Q27BPR15_15740 [Rhodobacter sp. CACIA14H1]|nr:MAG: hypothetical protein Q27BPR15_15740 [Rhodobacter sp. CACIA14H1]
MGRFSSGNQVDKAAAATAGRDARTRLGGPLERDLGTARGIATGPVAVPLLLGVAARAFMAAKAQPGA